jgi:hypothetical protein
MPNSTPSPRRQAYSLRILLVSLLLLTPRVATVAQQHHYLDQGWGDADREWFYYTTQGSRLIPYDWFLALELPEENKRFSDPSHLSQFGFLYDKESKLNPKNLPIGFAEDKANVEDAFNLKIAQLRFGVTSDELDASRDREREMSLTSRRDWSAVSFVGRKEASRLNFPNEKAWLGWTCAACHTGRVDFDEQTTYLVDGAPALVDIMGFMGSLVDTIERTTHDDAKFNNFAERILGSGGSSDEKARLRASLTDYNTLLAGWADRSRPTYPYGPARLDAFGILVNEIVGTAMELPENWRRPNAPVSYPFLWTTPDLDWVQWNGSVHSPLARNVGEVLGVFADLRLVDLQSVKTSAHLKNLVALEERVKTLLPPKWPRQVSEINESKAREGEKHYRTFGCINCHSLPPYPKVADQAPYRELIRIEMIPQAVIGTDPDMAMSFLGRSGKTGVLKSSLNDREVVPVAELLGAAVATVINTEFKRMNFSDQEQFLMNDQRGPKIPTPEHLAGYKARPLAGVWATAPYLHNGSVPTLFDLLLPLERRPRKFRVGSTQFDQKDVGFMRDTGDFEFDTSLPGNGNGGHEFAKDMTDEQRYELIEYLKTL